LSRGKGRLGFRDKIEPPGDNFARLSFFLPNLRYPEKQKQGCAVKKIILLHDGPVKKILICKKSY
jgi:hypothetical protein